MDRLKDLYYLRFDGSERKVKNELWKALCDNFLQNYIERQATVLDLGAGFCEFINNINCKKKIAVDINPEIKKFAADNVCAIIANCADMKEIADNSIDVVFASELFEHLKNTDELLATLTEIRRALKDKGRIIVLCPNIRYLADKYWDFIDHRLALSHLGLQEALLLYNYKIIKIIPRFLPYTTKSILPKSSIIMKIYLKLPLLWRIFGKQMLIIAEK